MTDSLSTNSIQGHSPLPNNVYIDKSPIHGMGLFAIAAIPKEHDFGITHVEDTRFPNNYIRTPFGGFINHSFTPNCKIYIADDTLRIKTIRDIAKGEELTMDYRPYYTEDELLSYN